jgi:drug/metabolite transporter (DMT)-like permease
VLWYAAVSRIGAARAGLLTGVVPVTAAVGGVLLGAPPPAPVVWAGMVLVAAGLAIGLAARPGRSTPITESPRFDERLRRTRIIGWSPHARGGPR